MEHLNVFNRRAILFLFAACLFSCTSVRKAPKNKPFITSNSIEVKGGNFSASEKSALISRLRNQIDDSAQVITKTSVFVFNTIIKPPAFDTGIVKLSADNMKASMFHLGYYSANVYYTAKRDTLKRGDKKWRTHVHYIVDAGKPTLIDTINYRMRRPELQQIVSRSLNESVIKENNPITKAAVLGEIARLVDTFRNAGYYKFTSSELRMRGDTTIEALTTVTDDPFEQLRLLAEAQQQRDSPKIRLALVLNPPSDSSRLRQYFINKVYVVPDFFPGDAWNDSNVTTVNMPNFSVRYRENIFKTSFLGRSLTLKNGDLYRQREFANTVNNFTRAGVWRSVNARLWELPNDSNKVNLVVELMPGRKFTSEASIEASYSATNNQNNAVAGNLFGLSLNLSLTNKNVAREAIRMTHNIRAGIELNNNSRNFSTGLVNSQELSYGNSVVFPRFLFIGGFKKLKSVKEQQTFLNTNFSYNNRLGLFNTQSANVGFGWDFLTKKQLRVTIRPVAAEFNYLFNKTETFQNILDSFPFLKYSYNTAFTSGIGFSLSNTRQFAKHLHSLWRERTYKFNFEESGLTYGRALLRKYLKNYAKFDFEWKYTVAYFKTAFAVRGFLGVGIPLRGDTTLPFFKQYFGGGSNSMRAWPIRGIGRGSQALVPYGSNIFNNRTGDIQVEANTEYRYDIATIIPNTFIIRGAVFVDVGNIWNMKNSIGNGVSDSAKFEFKNFYKELGVAAGTGFRFDLNYFIVRLDLGFRIKRPELSHIHNGWKFPDLSFSNLFPRLFGRSEANRRWRYENFNFTVGISYPF